MKKTILLLGILLVMISWYPLLVVTGWVREFTVTVKYPLITFLTLTLLFSAVSLHMLCRKEKKVNTGTSILSALLVPVSAAWLLASVWENRSFLIFLLALVWVTFSFALMFAYGNEVFLKGEISNFKAHSRGHFYFTLKDDFARLSAIMFYNNAVKLRLRRI